MDRILQTFKEYDMDVLLAKKILVSRELKDNKELQDGCMRGMRVQPSRGHCVSHRSGGGGGG